MACIDFERSHANAQRVADVPVRGDFPIILRQEMNQVDFGVAHRRRGHHDVLPRQRRNALVQPAASLEVQQYGFQRCHQRIHFIVAHRRIHDLSNVLKHLRAVSHLSAFVRLRPMRCGKGRGHAPRFETPRMLCDLIAQVAARQCKQLKILSAAHPAGGRPKTSCSGSSCSAFRRRRAFGAGCRRLDWLCDRRILCGSMLSKRAVMGRADGGVDASFRRECRPVKAPYRPRLQ